MALKRTGAMAEVKRLTAKGRLADAVSLIQRMGRPVTAKLPTMLPKLVVMPTLPSLSTLPTIPLATAHMTAALAQIHVHARMGHFLGQLGEGQTATEPSASRFTTPAAAAAPTTETDAASFTTHTFKCAAGARAYKLFVPANRSGEALPLVIMLHGCSQSPDDFAAGTGMNALANTQGFLVAYPGQPHSANQGKCWNWFSPGDQMRDKGEPSILAGITRQIIAVHGVDPDRVYVAGLSAGGAAAAILGQAYPDLFAAIGVHSGLACGAANDMSSAMQAMSRGGPAVRASGGNAVPTIVFHGDADTTVNPVNASQVISQSAGSKTFKVSLQQGRSTGGVAYTKKVHADLWGRAILEDWSIHGSGHAWSGGSRAGSFTDPKGPDASAEMIRFFLEHKRR